MKVLKLAIFSILTLFLLITVIGLLFPSQVTVIRRVSINAPKDSVYPMFSDIKRWPEWLFDSTHKVSVLSQSTTGKGAKVRVGHSLITITHDSAGYIESIWKAARTNDQVCGWNITQDPHTPGTLIEWSYSQHLDWYPWERVGAILNEKILGPSMDSSFARLKSRLEKPE